MQKRELESGDYSTAAMPQGCCIQEDDAEFAGKSVLGHGQPAFILTRKAIPLIGSGPSHGCICVAFTGKAMPWRLSGLHQWRKCSSAHVAAA
jgi:hypothetical protein